MFFTRKFLTRRELHLAGIIASAETTALDTGPFICWSSYSIAQSAVPSTNITPRHDFKSWKTSPQHKTTLITKNACERDYFLLILVSSAPANLERRNLIRQTKNNMYGDMIRADYYEHYWNQSLKIQMAFEWASRYCNISYLLKADDNGWLTPRIW